MKTNFRTIGLTALVALITISMTMVYAAQGEKGEKGEKGQRQVKAKEGSEQRGGGFNRDPEQMQKMMLEGVKKQIAPTDEEWTVIEPRLSKVMKLSMSSRFGGMRSMMGGHGGPGGPGGPEGQGPAKEVSKAEKTGIEKAAEELQTALKNTESTQEDIKAKLAALRTEKEKAQSELITAKSELLSVLSLNQEASLVIMGLLD